MMISGKIRELSSQVGSRILLDLTEELRRKHKPTAKKHPTKAWGRKNLTDVCKTDGQVWPCQTEVAIRTAYLKEGLIV